MEKVVQKIVKAFVQDDEKTKKVSSALLGRERTKVLIVDDFYRSNRWIVLQSISDDPILVRTTTISVEDMVDLHIGGYEDEVERIKKEGWVGKTKDLSMENVVKFFRGRCGMEEGEDLPETLVPAEQGFIPVSLAGDLGEVKKTTDYGQSIYYSWFDLEDTPIGGSIYRISSRNTLWVFTRAEEDRWEVTVKCDLESPTKTDSRGRVCHFDSFLEGALTALNGN